MEPREFLQQHIQRDLEQLTQTLGKSADETASTVHHILCRLLQEQRHLSGQGKAGEGLSLRGVVEQVYTESRLAAHTAEGDGRLATQGDSLSACWQRDRPAGLRPAVFTVLCTGVLNARALQFLETEVSSQKT